MPSQANQPLPDGTQLQGYRIQRVLAIGGFSFVYLAEDDKGGAVAIKEYLPATMPLRVNGARHFQVPADAAQLFHAGMNCFIEEAGAIARLQHPNVVRVLDFFRENETVYLVMRYEQGRSLREHIKGHRGPLEELFKPANVYLRTAGSPRPHRFRRRAPGPLCGWSEAAERLYARFRAAGDAHQPVAARHDVCLLRRCGAAA